MKQPMDARLIRQLKTLIPPPEDGSVRAFAIPAGVDPAKLYNLLNGHDVDINTKTLIEIVDALDCTIRIEPRKSGRR